MDPTHGKCVAILGSGKHCKNSANHPDPEGPATVLLLCGIHVKNAKKHIQAYKDAFNGRTEKKTLAIFPFLVNPGGNDNNAPPPIAPATPKREEEDMTEEEVERHADSVRADSNPRAIDKLTVSKGASKERSVAVVKIDNSFWVCNVSGSSADEAKWATFWTKRTGRDQPRRCQIKDCEREVGATGHMYWRDDPDGKQYNYLVPICAHHNKTENGYDWNGDQTKWLQCKSGLAVKILENPATAVKVAEKERKKHGYNLRERKPK